MRWLVVWGLFDIVILLWGWWKYVHTIKGLFNFIYLLTILQILTEITSGIGQVRIKNKQINWQLEFMVCSLFRFPIILGVYSCFHSLWRNDDVFVWQRYALCWDRWIHGCLCWSLSRSTSIFEELQERFNSRNEVCRKFEFF